jgi:hypothetical protein
MDEGCLSQQQDYKWSRKFRNGVTSVAGTACPGQMHKVVPPESTAAFEALLMENRQMSADEIAKILNMSHRSAHQVIHDVLQFHKVSARWLPRQLAPELKQCCADACEEGLWLLKAEGDGFLSRIFTGYETWVHCHQPETNRRNK